MGKDETQWPGGRKDKTLSTALATGVVGMLNPPSVIISCHYLLAKELVFQVYI